ncbi:hypothetical protein Belba_2390 [Belliella baltica DSM 15883]|uniref:Lipid A core-O-antigen ligase-like enyme n=2 Tax=Belliella TaxID=232244 RepID=I3Z6T2_BELBD|nr:hypothetical protein Belba_2390 [Belliella baltica DSM 15883]
MFLYIYNPMIRFLPFDSGVIISFLILLFYFFNGAPNLKRILKNKYIFIYLILGLITFSYTLILTFFSDNEHLSFRFPIMYFRFFFELPLVTIAILNLIIKFGYNTYGKVIHIFINIAIVQSFIVIATLLSPALRDFVFFNLLKFREGHDKIISIGDFSLRGFGLSGDYLFAFPLFQGFAAVLVLFFFKNGWFKYIFVFPLVLISSLVNARVGVVPVLIFFSIIALFYFISMQKSKIKILLKNTFFVLILLILIIQFVQILELNNTFSWIVNGFINIFGGNTVGSSSSYNIIEKLLGEHLFFPNGCFDFVFGSGQVIFSNPFSYIKSDIGYIQFIFYGGLFFLILIIFSFKFLAIGCLNYIKKEDFKIKIIVLAIMITVLFVHFKGNIYNYNSFMKLSYIIIFFIILKFQTSSYSSR